MIALAVAIATAAAYESLANEQPIPPPASVVALPANILPGTPAAEVVKLAQAGVDASVIQHYIASCASAFNLDANQIISLTDAGISSDMVNAMIAHDKNLSVAVAQSAKTPTVDMVSAPTTEVDENYFNDTLSPYGQWVEVEGYGRCWRPTVATYDSAWQPYCDRGRWVYTDYGWYWNSDYSWGVTFHYGRWFHHDRFGWCWWPDTVWSPSWVTWRSSDDYCGWAPLPPFTVYQPGFGFSYRGASVSAGFDFGLAASCFTFVALNHFCEPYPRYYCAPPGQIPQIFNRTLVINNYGFNNRNILNNGVSVTIIGAATRHPIQPVRVGSMLNAGRHGWRGGNPLPTPPRFGASSSYDLPPPNPGGPEGRREPLPHNPVGLPDFHPNPDAGPDRRAPFSPPTPPPNRAGDFGAPDHPQPNLPNPTSPRRAPDQRPDQHPSGFNSRNFDNPQVQPPSVPAINPPRNDWRADASDRRPSQPTGHSAPPPLTVPVAPSSGPANDSGRSSFHADVREQPRQFNPAPAGNSPPVASERSPRAETYRNYNQPAPSAPRNAAPVIPSSPPNASGQTPGKGDKSQNWPPR